MSVPDRDPVGIVSAGMYLPAQLLTAEDIANLSGLEERVIREKIKSLEKRMKNGISGSSGLALTPGGWRGKEVF